MDIIATVVKLLVLPPTSLFILGLAGWLLLRRRPKLGRLMLAVSAVLLIVLSMPIVGRGLYAGLDDYPVIPLDRETPRAEAIVILSAGSYYAAEFGKAVPDTHTTERLRLGARLQQALGLPILVTGGRPAEGRAPIADTMAESLAADFGVTARWRETAARNTLENAALSAPILKQQGTQTIYLVTHADHMRRSVASFEAAGFTVIPAPVGVPHPEYQFEAADLVPNAGGMKGSAGAIYEYLARAWYFSVRLDQAE